MAALDVILESAEQLTDEEKKELATRLGFPPPSGDKGRTAVWIVGLIFLGLTVFVFGYFGFKAPTDGARTAYLAVATTALGLFGGIFVPSPVAK